MSRGFLGVAFAFVVVMLGATLPTPLYPLYEERLGFGNLTVTVVFAMYAVGVVAALLLLGRASDVLGRRRLMLAAVVVSALSTVVFTLTPDLGWLYVARVVSGVSAGIMTTVGTVYLVELAPAGRGAQASLVATVVNMLGLGLGPPVAGTLSEVVGAPLVTPYAVHLGLLVLALGAVLLAPETAASSGGSLRGLRPRPPSVAPEARAVFVPAAIAAFAAFATLGLVTSVTSGILAQLLDLPDRALAGWVVFTLFAASALAQVLLRGVPTRPALRIGCVALAVGVLVLGSSLLAESLALLLLALAVIGVGQALCFRAGVAAITAQSPAEQRAQTVTSFFLVAYVGISFPVVLVGLASVPLGLRDAAIVFSGVVALLAVVSLAAQVLLERQQR